MRARKRFGQHFLEPAWVIKVVDAVAPSPTDRMIEIGPGRAALTAPLAARVERLVAVEVDRDLAALRRATATFHDSQVAAADGWSTAITGCMSAGVAGAMGFHYGNVALIDGLADVERPELLLYEPTPSGGLRLGEEPLQRLGPRIGRQVRKPLRPDHLERHDAVGTALPGAIDHAHAPLAELVEQFIITEHLAGPIGRRHSLAEGASVGRRANERLRARLTRWRRFRYSFRTLALRRRP